jgi:hypothetical protein
MQFLYAGFQAGELSPLLDGRVDLEALRSGCRLMRNAIPQKLGAGFQRPGFLFQGLCHAQATKTRLIPFTFSSAVTYRIELGHYYARFWHGDNLVVTQAGVPAGSGVVSAAGTPLVLQTPWSESEIFQVNLTQANDVLWLSHRSHWTRRLIRHGVEDWRIDELPVSFPPLRDPNAANITLAASATAGPVNLVASGAIFHPGDAGGYYGISHRRNLPFKEMSLSAGSGTASAVLTLTAIAVAGEKVSVGSGADLRVYTWVDNAAEPVAYQVRIGAANPQDSTANLLKAMTGTVDAAVGPGTLAHPLVTAEDGGTFPGGTKAIGTLTFFNNNLVYAADDQFRITGPTHDRIYTYRYTLTGAAWEVKLGATMAESIANAIKAVTGTGTAGVHYGPGTVAHADVDAVLGTAANSILFTAKVAGTAGNAIATTVANTASMAFGAGTLTGGVATASARLVVKARLAGSDGNGIPVSETMASGSWNTPTLTGGASISIIGETVRINGSWEVFTYGRWHGILTLKQERTAGVWETVRTFTSRNDFNAQSSDVVEGEKPMRLEYEGTGEEVDGAAPRAVLSALDALVHGVVKIKTVGSDGMSATAEVIRELHSTEPTYDWAEGAWSVRRGFPVAATVHEQRLMFGRDNTVWGSQVSGFDNFQRTTLEDASFAYPLSATQSNPIVSLASQRGLIILTEGDEWLMDGGPQSAAITAGKVRAERRSGNGSAAIQSVLVNSSLLFVQDGRAVLNEYLFDFQRDDYEAVDLTELAEHLGDEKFVQLAWAPNPHAVLWAVTDAGSLLSMTYRRKSGMIAWAKHTTPLGAIESVCSTPGPGGISEVWAAIRRTIAGTTVRTVEKFDPSHWSKVKSGAGSLLNVADGAVVYSGAPVSTLSGLSHLEGCTVGVLGDGGVQADKVVTGGQIPLGRPASHVVAGLVNDVALQPMLAEIALRDGTSVGRRFRVVQLDVKFYQTGACQYADDETKVAGEGLYAVDFRAATHATATPVPLFTGQRTLDLAGGFQDSTRVILRNRSMLPLHVLALVLGVSIHGD